MLALVNRDKTMTLWDVASKKQQHSFSADVVVVSWSPNGKLLALGTFDGPVLLWDVAAAKEIDTLKGHTSFVSSRSWSPDGKKLASASWDEKVKIWDMTRKR
jgi:WD40 repeat protein